MKISKKDKKMASILAKQLIKNREPKDAYSLAMIISERAEYYSDRWGDNGQRFEIIRILINECEKMWIKRKN